MRGPTLDTLPFLEERGLCVVLGDPWGAICRARGFERGDAWILGEYFGLASLDVSDVKLDCNEIG